LNYPSGFQDEISIKQTLLAEENVRRRPLFNTCIPTENSLSIKISKEY
jgi:hypothetical protein